MSDISSCKITTFFTLFNCDTLLDQYQSNIHCRFYLAKWHQQSKFDLKDALSKQFLSNFALFDAFQASDYSRNSLPALSFLQSMAR